MGRAAPAAGAPSPVGAGVVAEAWRIAVIPSRRNEIIWSFSRRSASSPLKALARTPISSRPGTGTAPV